MEPTINPDSSVYRILYFEEVYPSRAAEEQAEKSKLAAFGTLARLNPLNRPKADTVHLSKWELRYEPFWHLVARREIDYLHEAVYPLQITNPHARKVEIAGTAFEILPNSANKPRIDVQLQEFCHRKIDVAVHQFADARQRLMRLQAVGTGLFTGEGDLLLQPGDTNLEELIQVAGEDQQELQSLQQRIGLIQRLFQHADVELQL